MLYTKDALAEMVGRLGFEIGDFSYGTPHVFEWGEGKKLKIGRFCSIADGARIFLGGNHRTEWVSTYPFPSSPGFPSAQGITGQSVSKGDVVIGNDVWIGIDSAIMSGVTVGDGAVIAAGARVTKDVEPYAIVGGNPAKFLKFRFEERVRSQLLAMKWWDWPLELIRYACPLLCADDIDHFLNVAEYIQDMLMMATSEPAWLRRGSNQRPDIGAVIHSDRLRAIGA